VIAIGVCTRLRIMRAVIVGLAVCVSLASAAQPTKPKLGSDVPQSRTVLNAKPSATLATTTLKTSLIAAKPAPAPVAVDHTVEKYTSLAVFAIWGAIVFFGPLSSTATVQLTKTFSRTIGFLAFYFTVGALANTFAPSVYGDTAETWAPINNMFPTFFNTKAIFLIFLATQKEAPVWAVQCTLFTMLYNLRNDFHMDTGIGAPGGPLEFGPIDTAIVAPVSAILLYQYFFVLKAA